jgi:hypothetical protein
MVTQDRIKRQNSELNMEEQGAAEVQVMRPQEKKGCTYNALARQRSHPRTEASHIGTAAVHTRSCMRHARAVSSLQNWRRKSCTYLVVCNVDLLNHDFEAARAGEQRGWVLEENSW